MLVFGNVLVPVGGVLLAHLLLAGRATNVAVAELYDPHGPCARTGGVRLAGAIAWAAGAAAYPAAGSHGAMLPALATSVVVYLSISTWSGAREWRWAGVQARTPGGARGQWHQRRHEARGEDRRQKQENEGPKVAEPQGAPVTARIQRPRGRRAGA